MTIAVCDDEPIFAANLATMIQTYTQCELTTYTSAATLIDNYKQGLFDCIFLDVVMPEMDGFAVASKIREKDNHVAIVFVTNMEQDIRQGYKYSATDYITKPANQQDIIDIINRVSKTQKQPEYTLRLKNNGGEVTLPLEDIVYFESRNKDILAVTQTDRYAFRGQLSKIEAGLEGFVRVHQSYLVNKTYVFRQFNNRLALTTGEELVVSRRFKGGM